MSAHRFLILAMVLATLALAPVANAELAVSANDNKVVLVNGRGTVVQNPPPDTVAIIDLKASPPRVLATLEAGKSPAGVSINRHGTLALVANRGDGTVSVFTIQGKTVTPAGTVKVGDEKAGVSHVAIAPDGKSALVTRDGDNQITLLAIDGKDLQVFELTGTTLRDTGAEGGPAAIRTAEE
ncbi:MAG: hypothetical protein HY726_04885 [Candidatus Rokubacteria bacterium]|nr:hypothetical protein [Candidatus Rokubacteria bacterium]